MLTAPTANNSESRNMVTEDLDYIKRTENKESNLRRVLFLALDTYSRIGGLQRFNQRIISALGGLAHLAATVHIMRDTEPDIPPPLRAWVRGFGPRRLGFVFRSLAESRNADVVILGQLNLLPVGWLAKALRPNLKLILFVHGIEVWNNPIYRKRRFYEPFLLRSVDTVASVSQYTAQIMQREFSVPAERFVIFPNAIDGPLNIADASSEEKTILTVTRLAEHDRGKHVDKLIRAFARLVQQDAGLTLEIIGDGLLRPELEKLAQHLGVGRNTRFLGRVNEEELDAAYRRATVFALPSSKEGFGIVYLEAWKYGLPVICSTEGAAPEVVTHGEDGFAVDPEDIESIAQYISMILNDPQRAQAMGRAGARKLAAQYLDNNLRENLVNLIGSAS